MQYLGATPGFVEKVVADYIRGANLEKCIPGATVVDLEWFAAEAIEAAAIHALRHGMECLDTPGLHEQVCRAGLARLRDSNDRDAAEVRSQLEEALSRPPEPRDRAHRPSAEAVHDLTEALAEPLPSVASYDKWDPAAVARRIVPHLDVVRAKRAPVVEDLRPRQAVLLAFTVQRHVESHAQRLRTSTGAKVGRNDPCPCGSGKKYKRCCGVC